MGLQGEHPSQICSLCYCRPGAPGEGVLDSGTLPFLQGCADFDQISPKPTKFCESPPKRSPTGSWLISVRAPVGQLNYADKEYGIGRGLAAVRAEKGLDPRFLGYALLQNIPALLSGATGSTYEAVSAGQIGNLRVPKIGLQEQRQIAHFLDRETARIDELIEKRGAFIKIVAEKKLAVAERAVNGSILGEVCRGKEGWFGRLPADWPVLRAKFLFRERQQRSLAGEEELLTVSHITGVTRRSEKNVNMFLAESNEGYKLVYKGYVVINTMWAWMGAMGVSPVDGIVSPSYGVYEPTKKAFEQEYCDLLLRTGSFVAEATRRSKGIHSSRLRLYPDAFLDILLPVPTREAQHSVLAEFKIATKQEDELAELSRLTLDRLRELRSALITTAVTGHLDIANWQKRGAIDRRLDAAEAGTRT